MTSARHFVPSQGPTPEFVRWSIDLNCAIREPLDSSAPDKVEKYLRSLAAIGRSRNRGDFVDGFCFDVDSSANKAIRACRMDDVAAFYGGIELCERHCGNCPANIVPLDCTLGSTSFPQLAGCFGWLVRDESTVARLDNLVADNVKEFTSISIIHKTHPAWYGMWMKDKLEGRELDDVAVVFDLLSDVVALPSDWQRFRAALLACQESARSLSIEFVPAGQIQTNDWWIGPYCGDCGARQETGVARCEVCGRSGRGHQAIRRKVIGNRPFVELNSLVGIEKAEQLRQRWNDQRTRLDLKRRGASTDNQ